MLATETETRDRRTLFGLEVSTSVRGGALTHSSPGCTSLLCLNSQNFPAAEQLWPEKERQVWKHDLGSFLGFLSGANFSTDKGFQTFYPDSADLYLLLFTAWKCSLPAMSHESRQRNISGIWGTSAARVTPRGVHRPVHTQMFGPLSCLSLPVSLSMFLNSVNWLHLHPQPHCWPAARLH